MLNQYKQKGLTLMETMLSIVIASFIITLLTMLFLQVRFDNKIVQDSALINEIQTNIINNILDETDKHEARKIITQNLANGVLKRYESSLRENFGVYTIHNDDGNELRIYPKIKDDRILKIIVPTGNDTDYCISLIGNEISNFDLVAVASAGTGENIDQFYTSNDVIKNKYHEELVGNNVSRAFEACEMKNSEIVFANYNNVGDERSPLIETFVYEQTDPELKELRKQLELKWYQLEKAFKGKKALILALDDKPTATEEQKIFKKYSYLIYKIGALLQQEPDNQKSMTDLKSEMTKSVSDANEMLNKITLLN